MIDTSNTCPAAGPLTDVLSPLRHPLGDRSRAAATCPQGQGADQPRSHVGDRARLDAGRARGADDADEPLLHGAAVHDFERAHADRRLRRFDGDWLPAPQANRLGEVLAMIILLVAGRLLALLGFHLVRPRATAERRRRGTRSGSRRCGRRQVPPPAPGPWSELPAVPASSCGPLEALAEAVAGRRLEQLRRAAHRAASPPSASWPGDSPHRRRRRRDPARPRRAGLVRIVFAAAAATCRVYLSKAASRRAAAIDAEYRTSSTSSPSRSRPDQLRRRGQLPRGHERRPLSELHGS